MFNTNKTN